MVHARQRDWRRWLPDSPRRRLLHLMPHTRISTMTMFAAESLAHYGDEYDHTVLFEGNPYDTSESLVRLLQATGANVYHVSDFDHTPCVSQHEAAIFYDAHYACCWQIPTVYYTYTRHCPDLRADVVLAASEKHAQQIGSPADFFIPPAVHTRPLRGLYRDMRGRRPFTVGIMSSDIGGRFPAELAAGVLERLEGEVRMVITDNQHWQPTVAKVWKVPVMVYANVRICREADVVIYAHAPGYWPAFGRLGLELMASGVPMLCEARGDKYPEYIRPGHDALLFHDLDTCMAALEYLRQHPEERLRLGANAQLTAGWHDVTTYIGTIKRVLRALGA